MPIYITLNKLAIDTNSSKITISKYVKEGLIAPKQVNGRIVYTEWDIEVVNSYKKSMIVCKPPRTKTSREKVSEIVKAIKTLNDNMLKLNNHMLGLRDRLITVESTVQLSNQAQLPQAPTTKTEIEQESPSDKLARLKKDKIDRDAEEKELMALVKAEAREQAVKDKALTQHSTTNKHKEELAAKERARLRTEKYAADAILDEAYVRNVEDDNILRMDDRFYIDPITNNVHYHGLGIDERVYPGLPQSELCEGALGNYWRVIPTKEVRGWIETAKLNHSNGHNIRKEFKKFKNTLYNKDSKNHATSELSEVGNSSGDEIKDVAFTINQEQETEFQISNPNDVAQQQLQIMQYPQLWQDMYNNDELQPGQFMPNPPDMDFDYLDLEFDDPNRDTYEINAKQYQDLWNEFRLVCGLIEN